MRKAISVIPYLFISVLLFGLGFFARPVFAGAPAEDFTSRAIPTNSVLAGEQRVLLLDLTLPYNTTSADSSLLHDGSDYAVAAGNALTAFQATMYFVASTSAADLDDYEGGEAIIKSTDDNLNSSSSDTIISPGKAGFRPMTTNSGYAATNTDPGGDGGYMVRITGTDDVWTEGETIWIDVGNDGWTTSTDVVLVRGTDITDRTMFSAASMWASSTDCNFGFLDTDYNGYLSYKLADTATGSDPILRTTLGGRIEGYNIGSAEDEFLTAFSTSTEYQDAHIWFSPTTFWKKLNTLSYPQGGSLKYYGGAEYTNGADIVKDLDNSGRYRADRLTNITVKNNGTAQNTDISRLSIWEEGSSPGWDWDESEIGFGTAWDTEITVNHTWYSNASSSRRIYVSVDVFPGAQVDRTLQAQLAAGVTYIKMESNNDGPTGLAITGYERKIVYRTATPPAAPVMPLIGTAEAVGTTTIRWKFTDQSNNEDGFRVYNAVMQIVATGGANASFADETGLQSNTQYSGRKVCAYNAGGESSLTAVYPATYTLAPVPSVEKVEATETSIKVQAIAGPANLSAGSTGLKFENITNVTTTSGWIREALWTSTGLSAGTEYKFRVKARNGDGVETAWSGTVTLKTAGEAPVVEEEEVVEEEVVEEEVIEEEVVEEVVLEKPISEMTVEEIKVKIAEITVLIVQLQTQLAELISAPVVFENNLKYGDRGDEVVKLQEILIEQGFLAEGLNTGWFGPLTKTAAIEFQEKYADEILTPLGLLKGTGFVGPATREKLNELAGE